MCKDFIPIQKHDQQSLISQEYWFTGHVMLNCQQFQLDASRNKVTNLDSLEIQTMLESFRNWWATNIAETYLKTYTTMSHKEERDTKVAKKVREMTEIRANYPSGNVTDLESGDVVNKLLHQPTNEYTTALLFSMMVQSDKFIEQLKPISCISQHIDKSTDMIALNEAGQPILVELEYRLSNLFAHNHPLDSFDVVVVWSRESFAVGDSWQAPWKTTNLQIKLKKNGNKWSLKWGATEKPVIVLQDILEDYDTAQKLQNANPP